MTAVATTSTRTSPSPTTGSSTSPHTNASGPPGSGIVIAYIRGTLLRPHPAPRKHRGLHPRGNTGDCTPLGARGNCAKGGPGAKPPKTRTRRRGEEAPKGRGELRKPEGQGRQLLKTPPTPAQAPKMRVRDR
ncbi:hypothetical protein GCM10010250_02730 [Streptomyces althioticus]|nr:hypothetical protein GCM10010250_02730 [Streptomyces althioticus]